MSALLLRKSPLIAVLALCSLGWVADTTALIAREPAPLAVTTPSSSYDRLFPYWAEMCFATQVKRVGDKPGSAGGHTVLYLKGTCRDTSAATPRLSVCNDSARLEDPEFGVGVSSDKDYANVVWTAVDGHSTLLTGGLDANADIDDTAIEAITGAVLEKDYFRGVSVKGRADTTKLDVRAQRVSQTIGTDIAVSLARDVACVRTPVSSHQLQTMIDYLNGLNDGRRHRWSIVDSCVHPVRNALAAAGIDSPRPPGTAILYPSEEFASKVTYLNAAEKLSDVVSLYRDKTMATAFNRFGELPIQPGALVTSIPMRSENNRIWTKTGVFQVPLFGGGDVKRAVSRATADLRLTDLESNLTFFAAQLARARESLKPAADYQLRDRSLARDAAFPDFHRRFAEWLDRKSAIVMEGLNALKAR